MLLPVILEGPESFPIFVQSGEVHVTRRQVVNVLGILKKQNQFCVSLVVSTSRPIEIEIENVLSVETNF